MQIASIRPSTLDGIKQLAKKIKREQNLTHLKALDVASRQAGFESFVHARHRLAAPSFPVYLTVHWQASRREARSPGAPWAGREMLKVEISRPLPDVVAKHRVAGARGLGGFRMEYADHLEHRTNIVGQDEARGALLEAARSLRFMEATGLQPVTTQAMREKGRELSRLPARDHTSLWFDPASGSVVMLDEPYRESEAGRRQERLQWLDANGIAVHALAWEGIYYPAACPPYLVSRDASLVARLAKVLNALPPQSDVDPWPHPTALNGDDFVSPMREADAKPRKPRPGPSYRSHKGAVPYGGAPGLPSRWRPMRPLPLAQHQRLGEIFQDVSELGMSHRPATKLMTQRSLLEDWMALEHGSNATVGVYYGGAPRDPLVIIEDRLAALEEAKAIVESGYTDCKPQRELIAALDAALADLAKPKAA